MRWTRAEYTSLLPAVTPAFPVQAPEADTWWAARSMMERVSAIEEGQVMANLADGTGGTFFHGSNDLDAGFRSFVAPEYLYVLGFVPDEEKLDGRRHRIDVRLRNSRGRTVEARQDYYAPDYVDDPEGMARQEIEEAFFSGARFEGLPVVLQTQFFKTGEYDATVTVIARLDVRQLAFRQEGERNRNDVVVVTGLFDENGNYLSGTQKTLEMRLTDETRDGLEASGLGVRTEFDVRPGRYMVRVVVRDTEGQQLTALSDVVEVPW